MYIPYSIIIMALVTYGIRVLPVTLFRKPIHSRVIRSFLHYVPYAALGAMTFPHILYSTDNSVYALLGTLMALILSFFERSLTVVALLSVLVVYVCHFIL